MNTKYVTPSQYAKWKGCTIQNITKHIRAGNGLPHVLSIKNFSRFYLLEVSEDFVETTSKRPKAEYSNKTSVY